MKIDTYQREQLKYNPRLEQLNKMPGQAEMSSIKGFNAPNLGEVIGASRQSEAIHTRSLQQRLQEFKTAQKQELQSEQNNTALLDQMNKVQEQSTKNENAIQQKTTQAVLSASLDLIKHKGMYDAQSDLVDQQNQIRAIENSVDQGAMSRSDADQAIRATRLESRSIFTGIYGDAYNTVTDTYYNNTARQDAVKKADQAAQSAKMNPEIFKASWKTYTENAIADAPNDESKLIQERYYNEVGLKMYKALNGAQTRATTKAVQTGTKNVLKDLKETHKGAIHSGQSQLADESQNATFALIDQNVNAGYTTPEAAQKQKTEFVTGSLMETYETEFDQMIKTGQGNPVQYMESVKKTIQTDANFLSYDAEKRKKLVDHMDTKLRQEAKRLNDDVIVSLESGKDPHPDETKKLKQYAPYLSLQERQKLKEADGYNTVYQTIKDAPLALQKKFIEAAEKSKGADSVRSSKKLTNIYNKKLKKAQDNPVGLAEEEGLFDHVELDSPENLNLRATQAHQAQDKYRTEGVQAKFFTPQEVEDISMSWEGTTAEGKQKIIQFYSGIEDKEMRKIAQKQIQEKNKIMGGLFVLQDQHKTQASLEAIEGAQAIQDNLPQYKMTDLNLEINDVLTDFVGFADLGDVQRMKETITAIYAAKHIRAGNEKGIDSDQVKLATEAVLGVQIDGGWFGGSTEYAPTGVTEDQYTNWRESLSGALSRFDLPLVKDHNREGTDDVLEDAQAVKVQDTYQGSDHITRYKFRYQNAWLTNQAGEIYVLDYIPQGQ